MFDEKKWWPVTVNSHVSILSLANEVIPGRYAKMRRMSLRLTSRSPDAQLHNVRLQAKKLRYLLEFFSALYPEQPLGQLIQRLKKLQNTLGAFNDLAVQQAFLRGYVRKKAAKSADSARLVLAVGSLLGILHLRQQELRRQIFARLAAFTADETQCLVADVFDQERRRAG